MNVTVTGDEKEDYNPLNKTLYNWMDGNYCMHRKW